MNYNTVTMKKLILILIMALWSFQSHSQVLITLLLGDKLNSDGLEFGLEGGVNWAQISGMESESAVRLWNLGFYFDIRLKNQWSLYTGTLVKAELGGNKLTDGDLNFLEATIYEDFDDPAMRLDGDYSQKMNYFLVPVLIKYKFENHLYLEAGPQFGLMYRAWVQFDSDIDGKDATMKEYNDEKINRIDAGLMAGLGYQLFKGTGWSFGVKYYYGLVDVYKDLSDTKNNSIFLKMNIPVGAGKKPEKKEKDL